MGRSIGPFRTVHDKYPRSEAPPEKLSAAEDLRAKLLNAASGVLNLNYDVTAHKRIETALRGQADVIRSLSIRDELTALYNRQAFWSSRASNSSWPIAVGARRSCSSSISTA